MSILNDNNKITGYETGDNTFLKEKIADVARKAEIEIGDKKQPDLFYPQFKTKHWDNECNLSLRLVDSDYQGGILKTDQEKIEWERAGRKIIFYEKDIAEAEDGGFEIEVELAGKPASNVLEFSIQTKGLNFLYQDELTQEEKDRGLTRADNIIGSYAVYHSTKKNNTVGGKHYRSGKAFHIYRPYVEDANGNKIWCNLNIDTELEILTITVPQEFLNTAVYPVIIDPTFGYTSIGSTAGYLQSTYIVGTAGTLSAAGIISKMTAYLKTGWQSGQDIQLAIYNDDGTYTGNSTEEKDDGTENAWIDWDFGSPVNLAADDYLLVAWTNGFNIQCAADSGSSGQVWDITPGASYNAWPTIDGLSGTYIYSIYATYTLAPTEEDITKSLGYAVITTPSEKTKGLVYTVEAPADITKTLGYGILLDFDITKTLAYEVTFQQLLNKGLVYTVKAPVDVQKSLGYTVITQTDVQRLLTYHVINFSDITKGLTYAMKPSIDITKGLAYTVQTADEITKNLTYEIITSTDITKGLDYGISELEVIDSYSETDQDLEIGMYAGGLVGVAQSFEATDMYELDSSKMYLRKLGSPTGTVYVHIYEHSGVFGTSSVPTGSPLATASIAASILNPDSLYLMKFLFTGANKIKLDPGYYVIAVEYNGVDVNNNVVVGIDNSTPTHGGNAALTTGAWFPIAGLDTVFFAYGLPIAQTDVNKSLGYAIKTETSLDIDLTYAVLTDTAINKPLGYAVITDFDIDKTLTYAVLTDQVLNKGLQYTLATFSDINKTLEYTILTDTGIDKGLEYIIIQQLSITKALAYTIKFEEDITKVLSYQIFLQTELTKQLEYAVAWQYDITKVLAYSVITDTGIAKNLVYAIVSELDITKPLVYVVAYEVEITLALAYEVRIYPYCPKDSPYSPADSPFSPKDDIYTGKASLYTDFPKNC